MTSMRQKGIKIHSELTISKIEKNIDNYKVILSDGNSLIVECVMGATGRTPKISKLELDKVDVEIGSKGEILTNKYNQTNIDSIYAIGDVTDKVTLTPVALAEGHAFADREFGNKLRFISYDNIASAVFSQPSIAVVGFSQEDAEKKGFQVIIAGAGGAAHLPGMVASKTTLPVLGVPVPSKHLEGHDSLLSIVQMPKGIPVATFAIGEPGAYNAGLFAISLIAVNDK